MKGEVAAPSEGAALPDGALTRIAGRVTWISACELRVADAFSSIPVRLSHAAPSIDRGALVVVEGRVERGSLVEASVVETYRGSTKAEASEFSRFADDGVGRRLRARARAIASVRAYFDRQGFIEVETPVRVACPGLDAYVDAVRAEDGFLITSPEHHMKRLLVGGMPRIYQFARCSRAGEKGLLHQTEFSMLEWYRAFSSCASVLADTERIVSLVATELGGGLLRFGERSVVVAPPFEQLTVREAFSRFAGITDASELAAADEARYFQVFVDRVEPVLAQSPHPVFLTRFPVSQAALARPCADDPSVAERFELFVAGVELCNGFGELTCPKEQRRRFEAELERRRRESGRLQPIDERFLAALEEGLPPSAGNALGMDRLVALALGAPGIAEVMAFPE